MFRPLVKAFLSALFALYGVMSTAQNLYDPSTIQEIRITFGFSNWDTRLDTAIVGADSYTIAQSVEINGTVFDSVGVKYKGNSSYNSTNKKNPMHLELNHVVGGQAYEGVTDLKLSNGAADPTFVREALSYWILSHYMHCPRANFAKVYVNGVYYGLMTNVEHIGKSFLSDHFSSSGGALFKCTPVGGAGPGAGSAYPTLKWLGADSSLYSTAYEIKSDAGWADLLALIDTLNNTTAAVDQVLDVDRALWMLAFDNLLVNLDSYIGVFSQNYYLYKGDNRRFNSIVWDLNMSFGGFSMLAGSGGGMGGSLDSTAMRNLSPLAVSTVADRPLIKKLLENPTYKRMYLAHLRTILNEMFVTGDYLDKALELQALIDGAVQTDVNKFYTYAQFISNLYWGATSGGGPGPGSGGSPGIVSLVNGRKNYLLSNAEISAVPPVISDVTATPSPELDADAWVTAKITGTATTTWLGWRGATTDVFTRVVMYDDGQHQDGAAGDGVFGASFPVNTPKTEYYIYSENSSAGAFLPARAEHEFFSVETSLSAPDAGDVVINEVLADNTNGTADQNDELEDWIELYNNTAVDVNLTGLYLSDNPDNATKWAFPSGTVIPAHGYLVVWADEDGSQTGLHASFKLKASGEFVSLASSAGVILDSISFGEQDPDRSFGRFANGVGFFTEMPPTFAAENQLTSGVTSLTNAGLHMRVAPNPAGEWVTVALGKYLPEAQLRITDGRGATVLTKQLYDFSSAEIPVSDWPSGLYFISVISAGEVVSTGKVVVE
ncbi:MAG TPA: CotH kinase family protein [Saprospiraceae bacterium]|nr:CotH kinase family protein [Saprospiraceae bacterium]HPI04875.1 CotH kinase family protein [Saprospiraceae bacterium]